MREISELKRKEPENIKIKNRENIEIVLNILDHIIAGKRFSEFDSAKQMYLLDCQSKISDMQNGDYTEESLIFLEDSIDNLIKTFISAKDEINKAIRETNNIMTEEEHNNVLRELCKKWLGRPIPEAGSITRIYVDYRKNSQHMNRVEDTDGNIFFINDLEEI